MKYMPFLLPLSTLTERTLQSLDVLLVADDISQQCLHKLQAICIHHSILPSSHVLLGKLTKVGDEPVASSWFSDVWQGVHNGKKVCVKSLRRTIQNLQTIEKVNICYRHIFSHLLKHPRCCTGVLQGSSCVEKAKASERRSLHWCYDKPHATCVRMDAKRNTARICR